jgi:hypothetical protein
LEDSKDIIHGLIVVVILLVLPRGLLADLFATAKARLVHRRAVMGRSV